MTAHAPVAPPIDDLVEEIAGILARGVVRLHSAGALHSESENTLPELPSEGLEHSDPACPPRSHAVNADENPAPGTTSDNGGDA